MWASGGGDGTSPPHVRRHFRSIVVGSTFVSPVQIGHGAQTTVFGQGETGVQSAFG